MKYSHIFVVIIVIIICILFVNSMKLNIIINGNIPYINPKAEISSSTVGVRGVFATDDYNIGDYIEVCPTIKTKTELIDDKIGDYLFKFDEKYSLIAFGFCSMYNHSDIPNASVSEIQSNTIELFPIGIEKIGNTSALSIYPNPTNDIVNINGASITNIELYDILGQKIKEAKDKNAISVGDLSSGVYLIKVFGANDCFLGNYKIQKN